MANNRALLVKDITIFIDGAANELLSVSLNDLADAVAVLILNVAVLDNDESLKTSEGGLLFGVFLGNSLSTADDVALVVPELTLGVGSDASLRELLRVTLDELTNNVAVVIDHLARLVDGESVKDGKRWAVVFGSLLGVLSSILGSILGVFCGVLSVFGLSLSILSTLLNALSTLFSILSSLFSVLSFLLSILSPLGGIFGLIDLLLDDLGECLDLSDDVAILVKNLSLLVDLLAGALVDVTLGKLTDGFTILVEDLALLVDLEAIKGIKVRSDFNFFDLGFNFAEAVLELLLGLERSLASNNLNLANRVAILVEDLTLVVDGLASAVLDLALGELTNLLTVSIKDLALLIDLHAVQDADVESVLSRLLKLVGGTLSKLDAAEHVALGVDDLTLLIDGKALQVLDIALEALADLANNVAIVIQNFALGVNLETLEGLNARKLIFNIGSLLFNIVLGAFSGVFGGVLDVILGVLSDAFDAINSILLVIALLILILLVVIILNEVGSIRVEFGTGDDVAIVIEDLAVLVELLALDVGWVALNQVTNEVAILVQNLASLVGGQTLKNAERRHLGAGVGALLEFIGELVFGKELATTDEIAIIIKNLAVVTNRVPSKIFGIALHEATNGLAIFADEAFLINFKALEDAQIETTSLILDGVLDIVGGILSSILCIFGSFFDVIGLVVGGSLRIVGLVLDIADNIICLVIDIVSRVIGLVLDIVGSVFGSILTLLSSVLRIVSRVISGVFGGVLALLGSVPCSLGCVISGV